MPNQDYFDGMMLDRKLDFALWCMDMEEECDERWADEDVDGDEDRKE